jgi:hypothetical protein
MNKWNRTLDDIVKLPEPSRKKGVVIEGRLVVHDNGIRFETRPDLSRYYNWFVRQEFGFLLNPPKHGSHVSVVLKKIHGWNTWMQRVSSELIKKNSKSCTATIYPEHGFFGGGAKSGKLLYMLPIESRVFKDLRKLLNIHDTSYHLTIATNKHILNQKNS